MIIAFAPKILSVIPIYRELDKCKIQIYFYLNLKLNLEYHLPYQLMIHFCFHRTLTPA